MNYNIYQDLCFEESCEIRKTQDEILKSHLQYIMRSSQFYKNHFAGIDTDAITLDSLATLPVTLKSDFDANSSNFYGVSMDEIVDLVHTSGTSGTPNYIGYTESDLQRLEYNELQALTLCGITKSDTILLTCTMDRCFIAGLAYFLGSRAIGARAIRSGANPLSSQLKLIKDLNPTVIIGVPTFLQKLANFANSEGFDCKSSSIKKLICIGESLRYSQNQQSQSKESERELIFDTECREFQDASLLAISPTCGCGMKMTPVGDNIESLWGAKAYSTYASSETVTTFCECESSFGGHISPELGFVEILDDDNNILPNGEFGEVTITPFYTQGMPLVRYKTGDVAAIIDKKCSCGRNSQRITAIIGRKNQMIKCKGTKFYPNTIHNILDNNVNIKLYQIVVNKQNLSDEVKIKLALDKDSDLDEIRSTLTATLRVNVEFELIPFKELLKEVFPETSRKPIKYIELNFSDFV